ncbi:hypothetical protein SAY87_010164 [Trapa incisa]|uniref:Uncharacterized protein n=1 Tax=Trapa incisa TaxID=236973 RepID=A0AAN7GQ40_9MYRT|nr:hypothetical protein SAY87_010164 [Trapa incisa]
MAAAREATDSVDLLHLSGDDSSSLRKTPRQPKLSLRRGASSDPPLPIFSEILHLDLPGLYCGQDQALRRFRGQRKAVKVMELERPRRFEDSGTAWSQPRDGNCMSGLEAGARQSRPTETSAW